MSQHVKGVSPVALDSDHIRIVLQLVPAEINIYTGMPEGEIAE